MPLTRSRPQSAAEACHLLGRAIPSIEETYAQFVEFIEASHQGSPLVPAIELQSRLKEQLRDLTRLFEYANFPNPELEPNNIQFVEKKYHYRKVSEDLPFSVDTIASWAVGHEMVMTCSEMAYAEPENHTARPPKMMTRIVQVQFREDGTWEKVDALPWIIDQTRRSSQLLSNGQIILFGPETQFIPSPATTPIAPAPDSALQVAVAVKNADDEWGTLPLAEGANHAWPKFHSSGRFVIERPDRMLVECVPQPDGSWQVHEVLKLEWKNPHRSNRVEHLKLEDLKYLDENTILARGSDHKMRLIKKKADGTWSNGGGYSNEIDKWRSHSIERVQALTTRTFAADGPQVHTNTSEPNGKYLFNLYRRHFGQYSEGLHRVASIEKNLVGIAAISDRYCLFTTKGEARNPVLMTIHENPIGLAANRMTPIFAEQRTLSELFPDQPLHHEVTDIAKRDHQSFVLVGLDHNGSLELSILSVNDEDQWVLDTTYVDNRGSAEDLALNGVLPDGRIAVVTPGTVQLYTIDTNEPKDSPKRWKVETLPFDGVFRDIRQVPDGRIVIFTSTGIEVFDGESVE
jgi:hypothetical protein